MSNILERQVILLPKQFPAQGITERLKPNVETFGAHEHAFSAAFAGAENPGLSSDDDPDREWIEGAVQPPWVHPPRWYLARAGAAPLGSIEKLLGRMALGPTDVDSITWGYWVGKTSRMGNYLTLRPASRRVAVVDANSVVELPPHLTLDKLIDTIVAQF